MKLVEPSYYRQRSHITIEQTSISVSLCFLLRSTFRHNLGMKGDKEEPLSDSGKASLPSHSGAITQDMMANSLSVLGHNSEGHIVFSCSTLCDLQLTDISKLAEFCFLQKVILNNNNLTSLDPLSALRLVFLSASDNQLTEGCFESLASSASNLEHLELNNNKITSLSGLEAFPYLINFSASGNKITELKAENFKSRSLMRVQLSHNEIATVEPQAFSSAPFIRLLDVSHNQIEDMMFTSYVSENLEALFLAHNRISRICNSISGCHTLVVLDLKDNNLDSVEQLRHVCPAPGLRKLYVTGNPFRETEEHNDDALEFSGSHSEVTMEDTRMNTLVSQDSGSLAARKMLNTPEFPYAALTARHTFGKISSVVASTNVVDIPSKTDKAGELKRMPLSVQARLRILNFLPQLTLLNGVIVTPQDVARSIAYFEEERDYFA